MLHYFNVLQIGFVQTRKKEKNFQLRTQFKNMILTMKV